jgi:ketopantoate hydroxymethyltransferase
MDVTTAQVEALADAMWQLLDDMRQDGQSVCLAAKAQARVAYEPFMSNEDGANDDLMTLAEAERIMREVG